MKVTVTIPVYDSFDFSQQDTEAIVVLASKETGLISIDVGGVKTCFDANDLMQAVKTVYGVVG